MNDLIKLLITLKSIKGIGTETIKKIINDDIGEISEDSYRNFLRYENISKTSVIATKIKNGKLNDIDWNNALGHADNVIRKCKEDHIEIVTFKDNRYPENLLSLNKYPLILYVKGNDEILNTDKSVAIIGTRQPTEWGGNMSQAFGRKFGEDGFVIISGLAIGCDARAHLGALESDAPTIAILAHGLSNPVYPKQHRELANKIIQQGGALISEYEPTVKLLPQYLVERDKWQSGMSDGTIAVETGETGGTLHALRHTLENSRPLAMLSLKSYEEREIKIPSGNYKFISEGLAVPLFDYVDDFEKLMIKGREKRTAVNERKVINESVEHSEQLSIL